MTRRLIGAAAVAAGVSFVLVGTSVAKVQAQRARVESRATLLARIYWSEAAGLSRADEQVIYHVLRRVGGGRVTARAMHAYSGRATGAEPPSRADHAYIQELDARGSEPPSWPHSMPWTRVRGRWLATLERARQDLIHPPPNPCEGPVAHWGARWFTDAACREGWVPMACQGALNIGWCNPDIQDCPPPAAPVCG